MAFVGVVAVALVAMAVPAFAHATLESSTPAGGARLKAGQPPTSVSLQFDEDVQIPPGALRMFDGNGNAVAIGAATHGSSDTIVTATVPKIRDGTYVVTWRVVSADSHPVSGGFTFAVGTPTNNGKASVSSLLSAQRGDRTVGVVFAILRAIAFFSLLVLIGAIAFVRTQWPDAAQRRSMLRFLLVMWALVVVSALAGIALQAAYSAGKGFGSMFDSTLLREVLRSHFGRAWLVRAIVVAALFPLVRRPTARNTPVVNVILGALGIGLLATISYGGHALTGRWIAAGFTADLVHLTGASAWLGGLAILALALALPARPRGTTLAASRFSRIAAPAIALIVLSGTLQAVRQVDSWSGLFHTTYGRLLIAKVIGVGIILAAASASRDIVRQRLAPQPAPDEEAEDAEEVRVPVGAGPGAARPEADERDVRHLRDAVFVEVLIAIVVLALTAVLVNTEPARAASTGGAFHTTVKTSAMWFDVSVSPARAGTNTVNIVPRVPKGGAASVIELSAEISNPARGVAPIDVLLSSSGPYNTSYSGQVTFPFPGKWYLDIRATRTQVDESTARVTINVS